LNNNAVCHIQVARRLVNLGHIHLKRDGKSRIIQIIAQTALFKKAFSELACESADGELACREIVR